LTPPASPAPAPAPAAGALACPACGAATVAGDRFCEACGADLPVTTAAAPAAAAATSADPAPAPTPQPEQPEPDYAADLAPPGPPCASCGADWTQIQDRYCGVCGMKQPAPRDHIEVSCEGVAAVTDRGRRHHRNEDAFALRATDGLPVVAVVCDGVSTTVDPGLASQGAADAALAVLAGGGDLNAAHAAAQAAAVAVTDVPPPPDLGWPSCTFLAGVVHGNVVHLGALGDCRSFWLPEAGEAVTLTEDDSWAAEQISSGAMSPADAYRSPLAHTITRWLGRDADPGWAPRLSEFRPGGPGRLVLCSDGLWNYAEQAADVAAAAAGEGDALQVARRLTDFANAQGGRDNVTVVVIEMKGPNTMKESS